MPTYVHKWNQETDEYELVAEWHEDGTVVGDGHVAWTLSHSVDLIIHAGYNPADYYAQQRDRLVTGLNSGRFLVTEQ